MHLHIRRDAHQFDASCSTLMRVESYASSLTFLFSTFTFHLQYPHAGRILCIEWFICAARLQAQLAVPSCGSNPMHHGYILVDLPYNSPCSTLMRVESYASAHHSRGLFAKPELAVPSCGSNPMHPCDPPFPLPLLRPLAVPSCGSNPMHREAKKVTMALIISLQYPHAGRILCISGTFLLCHSFRRSCSTLMRVESYASWW